MLTEDENRTLTQVGPGTKMGDLLRRYWQPIAAVRELDERPTKRLQLLDEDLVLYRDGGGTYGLLDARCAHRLTDLSVGIVEDYGLRCSLHGWLYNETGQCLEQPLESEPFCHEIKLTAYPVQAKAGLLWAYLGPPPASLVPDWEPFGWEDGLVQIVFADLPCNWLQCQENAVDPIDIEMYHTNLIHGVQEDLVLPPADLAFDFDELEHGFVYRRAAGDATADRDSWTVGCTALWPNGLFTGDDRSCHFEWRVPVNDTATLIVHWFIDRVAAGSRLPAGDRFHYWRAPLLDEERKVIKSHALNRNFAIWLHQGPLIDRTKEFLVASDRGLVMLRDAYFKQIERIEDGAEPKATIRDPAQNQALPFTVPRRAGPLPDQSLTGETVFPYLAGQPSEIEALFKQVRATWEKKPAQAPGDVSDST